MMYHLSYLSAGIGLNNQIDIFCKFFITILILQKKSFILIKYQLQYNTIFIFKKLCKNQPSILLSLTCLKSIVKITAIFDPRYRSEYSYHDFTFLQNHLTLIFATLTKNVYKYTQLTAVLYQCLRIYLRNCSTLPTFKNIPEKQQYTTNVSKYTR